MFGTSGTTLYYDGTEAVSTTLNGAINELVDSLTVASAAGISAPATIRIGGELIYCTTLVGAVFSGCTRGYDTSIPASHPNGAEVIYWKPAIRIAGLANNQYIIIRQMTLHGGDKAAAVISSAKHPDLKIEDNWIMNGKFYNVSSIEGYGLILRGNTIYGSGRTGAYLFNAVNNVHIEKNGFLGNPNTGLSVTSTSGTFNYGVYVVDNDFESNGTGGVTGFGANFENMYTLTFEGNHIESNVGIYGVRVAASYGVSVNSNVFQADSLCVDASVGGTVSGNTFNAAASVANLQIVGYRNEIIAFGNSLLNGATEAYPSSMTRNLIPFYYGGEAPTAGTWAPADRVINVNPMTGECAMWIATVGGTPGTWNCAFSIPLRVSLTAQNAAIGAANLKGAVPAGTYRVSAYLHTTTASAGACASNVTIAWTYNGGAKTANVIAAHSHAVDETASQGSMVLRADNATNITREVTLAGADCSNAVYDVYLTLELI
ncbi:MAG: right-handed parallel beta-helix repeat-containing protein [Bryobacteraceae bacterium]